MGSEVMAIASLRQGVGLIPAPLTLHPFTLTRSVRKRKFPCQTDVNVFLSSPQPCWRAAQALASWRVSPPRRTGQTNTDRKWGVVKVNTRKNFLIIEKHRVLMYKLNRNFITWMTTLGRRII